MNESIIFDTEMISPIKKTNNLHFPKLNLHSEDIMTKNTDESFGSPLNNTNNGNISKDYGYKHTQLPLINKPNKRSHNSSSMPINKSNNRSHILNGYDIGNSPNNSLKNPKKKLGVASKLLNYLNQSAIISPELDTSIEKNSKSPFKENYLKNDKLSKKDIRSNTPQKFIKFANIQQVLSRQVTINDSDNSSANDYKLKGGSQPKTNFKREIASRRNLINYKKFSSKFHQDEILMDENEKTNLIEFMKQNKKKVYGFLAEREIDEALLAVLELMQKILDYRLPLLLVEVVYVYAEMFLDFNRLDDGIFYLNQLRLVCDMLDNHEKKVDIYMMLADTCKIIGNYKWGIKFCRKALQYSWLVKNEEKEVIIYDRIGILYFLDGDVKKASYYHERAINDKVEPKDSTFRDFYIYAFNRWKNRKLNIVYEKICKGFFYKLNLPLTYNCTTESEENLVLEEDERSMKVREALMRPKVPKQQVPYMQLDFILREPEFDDELPSPSISHPFENETKSQTPIKKSHMPSILMKKMKRPMKLEPVPHINHKETLEQRIERTDKTFADLNKNDHKFKENVLAGKQNYVLNDKLYVQHLGPNRCMFDMDGAFYKAKKKYVEFFNKVLEE